MAYREYRNQMPPTNYIVESKHVEKARDDEHRWRQHVRSLAHPHVSETAKAAGITDSPHP